MLACSSQAEESCAMGRCDMAPEIEREGKERGGGPEKMIVAIQKPSRAHPCFQPLRRSKMVAPAIDTADKSRVASQLETFKRRIGPAIDRCMSGRGEHLKDEVDTHQ
jgi:hypothetical protein